MKSRTINVVATSIFAMTAFGLLCAGPASATTFCVPAYFAGCTNNGTNVPQANLETAMTANSSDGQPDTVMIDDFDYVDPDTLQPLGTDHLNVIGSGTDKTTITSSDNGNQFVANLSFDHRHVDMSNVTIVVPASFPDVGGQGSGLQAEDGTFDHVDIKSLNTKSDGAPSLTGNTVWKNSRIYAEAGGSIDTGIKPNDAKTGKLEIINTTIEDSVWGLSISGAGVPVVMKRSRIVSPVGYGVFVAEGGLFVMENSIVEGAGLEAVQAFSAALPGESDIDVSVRASTFIAEPAADTAAIKVRITGSHDADVDVSDSIIFGYENTWEMVTPAGPGLGVGLLTFTFSDFKPVGLPADAPNVNVSNPGNIDNDPELTSDLSLKPGSPAIDAGNPEAGVILEDFAGNVRPQDGDGDGSSIRDMGAFESPKVPTCKNTLSLCPVPTCKTDPKVCPPADKVRPKVTKVKFRPAKGKQKSGTLKLTLSEAARVKATFKPKGKGKKKRKTLKIIRAGKAGVNRIRIKKKKLKPGRYRLTIVATDAAGNRSKALVRKVKVR